MRKIELLPGVSSSVLGFGCAPIGGSADTRIAERAIHCALDHGITHFDLARSYGYGDAEAFVGKMITGRRDKLVLASKFGLKANWKASLLAPLKPAARKISALRKKGKTTPGPVQQAPQPQPKTSLPGFFLERTTLTPAIMRASLERSLKALRTDHLDIFMIHDPVDSIPGIGDLSHEAAKLKTEGKIRGWGLAFYWENLAAHSAYLDTFDLLQFNCSPGGSSYPEIVDLRKTSPNIFFSPLRESGKPPSEVFPLICSDFRNSVILCSMFKESHIRSNAELAARI